MSKHKKKKANNAELTELLVEAGIAIIDTIKQDIDYFGNDNRYNQLLKKIQDITGEDLGFSDEDSAAAKDLREASTNEFVGNW